MKKKILGNSMLLIFAQLSNAPLPQIIKPIKDKTQRGNTRFPNLPIVEVC